MKVLSSRPSRGLTASAGTVVLVYLAVFFVTRLVNLVSFPLFIDEARHILRAQATLSGDIFIGLRESLKQLYVWLVAISFLGGGHHILAARLVSVLSGLLTAGVCYRLAVALYRDRWLGFLAALFYLLSPFSLFYDRLALTDTLLTLLMGLSLLLSAGLWQQPSARQAIFLGGVLGLAALTKAYAVLYYPAPILFWLLLGQPVRRERALKLVGIAYATALPAWLPIILVGRQAYQADLSEKLLATSPQAGFWQVLGHNLQWAGDWLGTYLTGPFAVVLLLAGGLMIIKRDRPGLALLSLSLTLLGAFVLLLDVWYSRYLLPLMVPVSVIIAWGIRAIVTAAWPVLQQLTRRSAPALISAQTWQGALFLVLCLPALAFDIQIIVHPAGAPLPAADRRYYIEGRFSGYGLKESGQVVARLAEQYPELILLQGTNLMDTNSSLDAMVMSLYLPEPEKIAVKLIGDFNQDTIQTLDDYARQAPTLAIRTAPAGEGSAFTLPDGSPYPQAWPLASFPKPGGQMKVTLYQWLLPADFARRWFEQGGETDPRVAGSSREGLSWPPVPDLAAETLAAAGVEYVLADPGLIESQPELFEPYLATDGARLYPRQLPPGWRLAFAYPDITCAWCLFRLGPPSQPVEASFGQAIRLAGYDLVIGQAGAEQALYVTLYWDSLVQVTTPYLVFIHLAGPDGQIVGQADEPPLQGKWPTSTWPAGARLADRHKLVLDPALPAGDYTLWVGLYRPETGERLAATAEKQGVVDNAVRLATVSIPFHTEKGGN